MKRKKFKWDGITVLRRDRYWGWFADEQDLIVYHSFGLYFFAIHWHFEND
jgi:hypothetical protein